MLHPSKLGLGTAQFGMPYGVTNRNGQISLPEVRQILRRASDAGVEILDTAAAYGESEAALGAALEPEGSFRIVTKIPPVPPALPVKEARSWAAAQVEGSLARLRQKRLDAVLLHRAADAWGPAGEALGDALQALKQAGKVGRIGVSVYSPAEIGRAREHWPVEIVQAPLNIFDQRFIAGDLLRRLHSWGIEFHARSLFLQGVLLSAQPPSPHFEPYRKTLEGVHRFFAQKGFTPLAAIMNFLVQQEAVDAAFFGVSSAQEFDEIIEAARRAEGRLVDWSSFASNDENLINPTNWKRR